jgi:hypothetical protein
MIAKSNQQTAHRREAPRVGVISAVTALAPQTFEVVNNSS